MPVKRLLAVAVVSVTVVALLPANVRLIALVAVVLAATVSALVMIERSSATDTILTDELRPTIRLLQSRHRFQNLCRAVGLTHISRVQSRWSGTAESVEHLPRVVGPARYEPFGAVVNVVPALGHSADTWRSAAPRLQTALSIPQVVVVDCSDHLELQLRTADPLASPLVLDQVPIVNDLVLNLGIDEAGASISVQLANKSGVIVGGLPGSGKTAWLTGALGSLAPSPLVQMCVIDGKGGHDLESLRCRSYRFHGSDASPLEVRDTLRDIELVVQQRRRVMPDLFGTSNFWSAPLSPTNPVLLVLIDEAQQLLPAAFSTKDDKQIASEIETILRSLVRLGRSAGCVVVLSTQRPTADAIPTAIRDNAEVRICFNVRNRDSAVAVLGELTSEDAVSSIGLPQGVGVSFVDGALRKFRAPFVPEAVVAEFVQRHQSLTADPLDLLSRALADVPDHVPDQAGR